MACRSGTLQRAHILLVEPNGRRNQSRHTLTIQRATRRGNSRVFDSAPTIWSARPNLRCPRVSCPSNVLALSREPRVIAFSAWLSVERGSSAAAPAIAERHSVEDDEPEHH